MKYLLDTHVWIWGVLEPDRINTEVRAELEQSEVGLSPITLWETLVLIRKGRIEVSPSPAEWIQRCLRESSTTMVPLTHEVALGTAPMEALGSFDPADQLLAATALQHDLTLVTADRALLRYGPLPTLAAA